MASLRYMTVADEVLRGLVKRHSELGDPERRLEIAHAVAEVYSVNRTDTENKDAIRTASEALLGSGSARPSPPSEFGEIYVYNIAWLERGAIFATESHHISSPENRGSIEQHLADSSDVDGSGNEGVSWVAVTNNVPFDILTDDTVVRFLARPSARMEEIGRISVSEMRKNMQLDPLLATADL